MITAKLDVTRIDKLRLYKGKKGTYLELAFIENRDGKDDYGNDGFVVQSVSKEERDRGEKGPIIGNWKRVGQSRSPKPSGYGESGLPRQQRPQRDPDLDPEDDSEVPF